MSEENLNSEAISATPDAIAATTVPVAHSAPETAVAVCTEAYTRTHMAARKGNRGSSETKEYAAAAYRRALPTLSSPENIRCFIACVAHGMAIGAIEGTAASRLLYAAQVAKGAQSSSTGTAKVSA